MRRLYSAWNDKSRTFRFQNGSVDWELVKRTTPWTWGIENDKQAEKEMKDVLRHHDINFNPNNFGIGKFEEMMEFKLSSKIVFEDSIHCNFLYYSFHNEVSILIYLKTAPVPYSRRFTWEAFIKCGFQDFRASTIDGPPFLI